MVFWFRYVTFKYLVLIMYSVFTLLIVFIGCYLYGVLFFFLLFDGCATFLFYRVDILAKDFLFHYSKSSSIFLNICWI